MADKTGIEWTDSTWNVLRGCSRVSEGCRNCYAETVAARFAYPKKHYMEDELGERDYGRPEGPYHGLIAKSGQWNGQIKFVEHLLDQPLRWKKPRRIFVNSMSDLFHENVSFETIDKIFAVMMSAEQHTFQVLTKRPERMLKYISDSKREDALYWMNNFYWRITGETNIGDIDWPPKNVWLGVSVEDQKTANERIPLLLQTPAAVRWISAEPLLGAIDLTNLRGVEVEKTRHSKSEKLDWVVVGGESGKNARPMHPDWARSLRDQCVDAGVAYLFKQWGEWIPRGPQPFYPSVDNVPRIRLTDTGEDGQDLSSSGDYQMWMQRVGKKKAGRVLDGRFWDEYPEVRV